MTTTITRPLSAGEQFLASPAWRQRTGCLTAGVADIAGYLGPVEERTTPDDRDVIDRGELRPAPPLIAPIAARCDTIPAAPGKASLVRWKQGTRPLTAGEGFPKTRAGLLTELHPVSMPYVAHWVPIPRAMLDDNAQLSAAIDGRLRRGLALVLDERIGIALRTDAAIPLVPSASNQIGFAAAIRHAVGLLAAAGYFGDVTVLIAPGDLTVAPGLSDLAMLGVTAVIPTLGMTSGYAVAADLRAAVQVRYHHKAEVSISDTVHDYFLRNQLVLLAEQRAVGAVADPEAAVRVQMNQAEMTEATRMSRMTNWLRTAMGEDPLP
jgi:hypothetical protein